jgi:dihydroorotate dehydrogenase (fumarate)
MNLSTTYLGLKLKNPIVPSSSPLMTSVDNIKKLEDAGAAAVVLHSLFEEQITNEALRLHYHTTQGADSFAEALSYFPEPSEYRLASDDYVEHIAKVKKSVSIPVIASLNGVSTGGWTKYARLMQDAGADAIELNLYYVATDPMVSGELLEVAYLETLKDVRSKVEIPITVKMSPFFTSIPSMARRMLEAGSDGLVFFNRFYQPDLDVEELKVKPHIVLSDSSAIRLPLRWIAILHGRLPKSSIAGTGGVHTGIDAIKLLMAGADVTYICSAILRHGISYPKQIIDELTDWMVKHEYESVEQMKGSMSQKSVADPAAFERALYLKELQSFH